VSKKRSFEFLKKRGLFGISKRLWESMAILCLKFPFDMLPDDKKNLLLQELKELVNLGVESMQGRKISPGLCGD
jgi:hypothetical protein